MGTLGFDIEFFVADNLSRKVVPVCGKVGGNKEFHRTIPRGARNGDETVYQPWEIHEDNVTLEVNSPVFTEEKAMHDWISSLHSELNHDLYYSNVPVHLASWHCQSTTAFPMDALTKAGPKALEIGCDPDYCAYNDPPNLPRKIDMDGFARGERYNGAHVHVGYSNHNQIPPHYIVRMLDMIALANGCFRDKLRGKVYGPGLFRPKPYGVEYRSLGTSTIMSAEGKAFCRIALALANRLEQEPQEMARIYGMFSPVEWGLVERYWEEREKKTSRALETLTAKAGELFYTRNWAGQEYLKAPPGRREVVWTDEGIEGQAA